VLDKGRIHMRVNILMQTLSFSEKIKSGSESSSFLVSLPIIAAFLLPLLLTLSESPKISLLFKMFINELLFKNISFRTCTSTTLQQ
jgi:hypothetical protein